MYQHQSQVDITAVLKRHSVNGKMCTEKKVPPDKQLRRLSSYYNNKPLLFPDRRHCQRRSVHEQQHSFPFVGRDGTTHRTYLPCYYDISRFISKNSTARASRDDGLKIASRVTYATVYLCYT